LRTGRDVDQGKITDPDDRDLFSIAQLNSDGSLVPLDLFSDVTIGVGQRGNFRVFFNPLIPAVAAGTTDLAADQVLPDIVTSEITFGQNFGAPLVIELVGQVTSAVQLIDPDAPRNPPLITLTRSGDEFDVQYSVYDSTMDIDHATYQFFDKGGNTVGKPFTADLSQVIRQNNFVRGQSFTLVQKFTGAEDHPEVASILVTVFDSSKTSDSSMSSEITGQGGSAPAGALTYFHRATIFLAPIKMENSAARLMGVSLPKTVS
jgi:hypothetical protein